MIELGRELDGRSHANIKWVLSSAEAVPLDEPCDLVVAAASIAWMDHYVVFPRLATALCPNRWMAVIRGDDAYNPPWKEAWRDLLEHWLTEMGEVYDPAYSARGKDYQVWMEVEGEQRFTSRYRQRLEDFIACQHSRAAWTRTRMGPKREVEFGRDIRNLLTPYLDEGFLHYNVESSVVWGRPLAKPKDD